MSGSFGQPMPSKRKGGSLDFNRKRKKVEKSRISGVFILIAELAAVCAAAYLIAWFFGYKVTMHGQSMEKGIYNEDTLLLNRAAFVFRDPQRGDIVAFRPAGNPNTNPTIKRIIGVPGDTIRISDGYLYINGEEYKGTPKLTGIADAGLAANDIILKDDEYFCLGDNTGSSEDSRFPTVGNISKEDIMGIVWWNMTFPRIGIPG